MALPFQILGIDHLRFECGNARLTAQYYCSVFGFSPYAFCNPVSAAPQPTVGSSSQAPNPVNLFHTSGCVDHVVAQGKVKLVFTAATNPKHVQFARRLVERSDSVVDIALEVNDVAKCFDYAVANGAEAIFPPTEIQEEEFGTIIVARIKSPLDSYCHTLVDRSRYAEDRFLPGFTTPQNAAKQQQDSSMLITHLDHIAIACYAGTMNNPINWYSKCLGMQRMAISDKEDPTHGLQIFHQKSGLKLKTLITIDNIVNFTFVEPIEAGERGQVRQFLDAHSGPGVQHIAFYSTDITQTVRQMRERSPTLSIPIPSNYYEHMLRVPEMSAIKEDIKQLEDLNILIDFEHLHYKNLQTKSANGEVNPQYLLQIFTPPMCDRPTYFIELITRRGATGFGQGNITQLYKCMEELLKKKKEVLTAVAKAQRDAAQTPQPNIQSQVVASTTPQSEIEAMGEDFNIVFADELFSAARYRQWAEKHNKENAGARIQIIEAKFETKTPEQIRDIVQNAHVIVASFFPITESIIRDAAKCKLIMAQGSGYNHVDVRAAKEHGITVCNNPNWCNEEVAEHVISCIFALGRDLLRSSQRLQSGQWAREKSKPLAIRGSTLGVVGMGNIGRVLCKKASALGMKVIAFDPYLSETMKSQMLSSGILSRTCDTVEELLREADFVSLHAPLTDTTRNMINTDTLSLMKESAFLINTARGEIINTDDLVQALKNNVIAGAALDVFESEPLEGDSPLAALDNVILTPHIAGVSNLSFDNGAQLVIEVIEATFQNDPRVRARNLAAANNMQPAAPVTTKASVGTANKGTARKTMRDIRDLCIQMNIPNLAAGMPEYAPPKDLLNMMSQFAAKQVQQRLDYDDLSKPEVALQAAKDLSSCHMYQERFGEPDFLRGVLKLHQHEHSTTGASSTSTLPANCFLATSGVTGAMVSTLHLIKETRATARKARIALIEPFYTYHLMQARSVLGEEICEVDLIPSKIGKDDGCTPDLEAITNTIQGRNSNSKGPLDLLILSNPWNPAGRLWRKDELLTIINSAATASPPCYVFIDEIYKESVFQTDLWYSPGDAAAVPEDLKRNVIVARGFSKSMAVGGWRMAYTIAHPETIQDLMRQHDRIYISGVAVHQKVVGQYLLQHMDSFKSHVDDINDALIFNWKVISEAFEKAFGWKGILPEGSIYGMVMHNCESDERAFTQALQAGVGVCPGNMFCRDEIVNSGFLRIQLAVSKEKAQQIAHAILNCSTTSV